MFESVLKRYRRCFGKEKRLFAVLDNIFGICPRNIELYKLALIHRSASLFLPGGIVMNNERLEFLGDAILESIVSDYLFLEYPELNEGNLTQMRSKIVSRTTLNQLCMDIGLAQYLVANSSSGITQKHIYGDAFEAIVGAIYLDRGFDYTNRIIINNVLRKHLDLEEMTMRETDFKSRLIEWSQKSKSSVRFDTGYTSQSTSQKPDFRSTVYIEEIEAGYGTGSSKKEAEQMASFTALEIMSEKFGDNFLETVDNISRKNGASNPL